MIQISYRTMVLLISIIWFVVRAIVCSKNKKIQIYIILQTARDKYKEKGISLVPKTVIKYYFRVFKKCLKKRIGASFACSDFFAFVSNVN